MTTQLEPGERTRPTREALLAEFGDEYLSIQSLFRFCFVPGGRINLLKELALEEDWGANNFVLLKYLAVHVRLAIEQGNTLWNSEQLVLTVGRLTTKTGAPVYAGLVPNAAPEENPWVLNWVGERPSCADLPAPPELGPWPELDPGAEVVVACEIGSDERQVRVPLIEDAPAVAQICAIAGAVQWSLRRGLAVRQLHGGGRGWFVPLYLEDRTDLERAPDAVAPLVAQGERVVVRTLLEPYVAYTPARVVVERREQLPAWLLDAWDEAREGGGADAAGD